MTDNTRDALSALAEYVLAEVRKADPDTEGGGETDGPALKRPPAPRKPQARRSGKVAVLLALLMGSYGIHNFYLKRPAAGVVQLIMTLFLGLGDLALMWAVVELFTVCRSRSRFAAESLRPAPADHIVSVG